ncbi:hypothetical protein HOLleu_33021 [Holothuria leucospilota]|uniref:Uncharacterized protein n=1 Tax=Holothuria leucospilota TaxID=206669 RepID=A0A9Q1BH03_HOLLE|nr:hypothetical protein HOLleu_33021 [Holothuria leucospilota]
MFGFWRRRIFNSNPKVLRPQTTDNILAVSMANLWPIYAATISIFDELHNREADILTWIVKCISKIISRIHD